MRQVAVLAIVCALVASPLAGVATGMSTPDTTSDDLDVFYVDGNDNLKYIDSAGNINDTGVQAIAVGGYGQFDGDSPLEVAFIDTNNNLKTLDQGGNTTDTGVNANDVGAMVDFDDDNDQDILYQTSGNLRAVDNDGNTIDTGETNVANVGGAGDIDGQGDIEVAFADSNDNLLIVDANGNRESLSTSAAEVGAVIDLDDDSELEIVHTDRGSGTPVNVFATEGDGSSTDTGVDAGYPQAIGGAGDSDADGTEEVTYAEATGDISTEGAVNAVEQGGSNSQWGGSAADLGAVVDWDEDGAYDDAPTVSNPSPSSTTVSADPVTLSVDVDDPEFPIGDTVTVDFDHNGNDVTETTISSAQTVTADVQDVPNGSNSWSVTVTDTEGNSNSYSYSYTADYAPPSLSNPDPTGNISSYGGDISINITDPDFPNGDTVTVNATDSDGNEISQTTVSSNQTVSFDYVVKAGANNITWSATDSHQLSDTAAQDFDGPTFLSVRNESDPGSIINTSSNVTATFFAEGSETVVKKSSNTGRFDFTGLPAAKRYVVSVDAEGYRPRQVVIDSLFEQQSVYLLPENASAATIEFQLNDQTSRFPSESTTLFVEIPLTRNNTTEYRTAFADEFGATDNRRVTLRDDTRYRLKVRNGEGEVRVLESYTTAGDAIATLTIGQVGVSGEIGDRGVAFAATVIETNSGRALRIVYRDPEQLTDNVEVGVEYNGSQYVPNTTGTGTYGRFITTVQINNSTPDNATFNVSYTALRDGPTIHGQTKAGAVGELDLPVADLPLSLLGWMLTIGLTSMVVIRTPRLAPATGTVTASMLTVGGVLAIPAPALGISGAISVLAVVGRGGGQ